MKKVLVLGGSSKIAQALIPQLRKKSFDVYTTTRHKHQVSLNFLYLDLVDVVSFKTDIKFDSLILCASLTKIHDCEMNVGLSGQINYRAQIQLVEYFKSQNPNIHVLFLSTNAVFDGKKPFYDVTDKPCPKTVYGLHKAMTEEKLQTMHPALSIIRLTKVLTPNFPLLKTWIHDLENKKPIYPFADVWLAPIAINQVVDLIIRILVDERYGLFHISGQEEISYYRLAQEICHWHGLDEALVQKQESLPKKNFISHASLNIKSIDWFLCEHDFLIKKVLNNIFEKVLVLAP